MLDFGMLKGRDSHVHKDRDNSREGRPLGGLRYGRG